MYKGTLHDRGPDWCKTRTGDDAEASQYCGLPHRLAEMGPATALFGRYLATRIDILPPALCAELTRIPDAGPPTSHEAVRQVFVEEFGCQPEHAFQIFQPVPVESRRLWQAHHATLSGWPVLVRIMHPAVQSCMTGAEFPSRVSRLLSAYGVNAEQLGDAIEEFRQEFEASRSFEGELRASSLLALDAKSFDVISAPRPISHLCTPRVAVFELGRAIGDQASVPDPDLARTLCLAWLHQALQGRIYPVDPRIENIAFSSDGRVLFNAGPFASLAERTKAHLLEYLIAVAAENTDEAYSHLSLETAAGRAGTVDEELRRSFRQTVAFRDGPAMGIGSSSQRSASGHRFTDEVLIHWRFMSQRGPMETGLISFYRALFTLVNTAQSLAPDRDSLAEALYDLRLTAIFVQARDMLRPSEVSGMMELYATALLGMPQQIDRLLTNVPPPENARRSKNSRVALASLLLALGAVAMLFQKISRSGGGGSADRLLVTIFVAIGLVLLWLGSKLA